MADAKKVIWAIKSQLGVHEALGTSHSYNAIVLGDALSVIEEQQGRIDNMLSLLDEADREKERLKEEIELLKAQPTIPAIMKL